MNTFTALAQWFDTWGFELFVNQLTRDLNIKLGKIGTTVLDTAHMSYQPADNHCWIVFHVEDSNGNSVESYRIDGTFQALTQGVAWEVESFRKVTELLYEPLG